ncbi:outer membrane lipid asymmetry maintenance protein MlaD [Echinimonas agarilytica]|uniref:Outer membrane lipid asymmetry maintenance protein MlaD n=1 Tax=Echinimonas agarilytica TaxID=1215918 RepID=A0AA41W4I2_9GAMM|nr:outer membrane lipid asymmetry maintenance protein MlaD [Echinimonas agarilytica]MCM2678620.1 outer membrane lipid asymmetry maintenance protein MlaD [Echinimonas agarilytica]
MDRNKQLQQRKLEIAVGLFVVLAISALAVLSYKVATWGVSGGQSTYSVFARFDNIGGLKDRAPVKIGGVVIGRVASIRLETEYYTPVVELRINSSYDQLAETSSASILTSGLLGEQYIGISPGFVMDDIAMLKEGDYIDDTKPAMVLEDMIGQFLYNQGDD